LPIAAAQGSLVGYRIARKSMSRMQSFSSGCFQLYAGVHTDRQSGAFAL